MTQPNQREPWWAAHIDWRDLALIAAWILIAWLVLSGSKAHGHDCVWSFPRDPVAATLLDKIYNGRFQACMQNATTGCCADVYDVDEDGDVDLQDFGRYVNCTSEIYKRCPTCSS